MNKDNALEYLPALQALADGELQIKTLDGRWVDDNEITFSFFF